MVRYLKESDVQQLLTMPLALERVERALQDRALGRAVDVPRVRTRIPAGTLHVLEAAAPELKLIGYKAYYSARGKGTRFFVQMFDTESGKLDAILEASYLGMVRTGAASGVATRHMARGDAAVVGMIGAGKQAVGQLEAVCQVRAIREVRVYSRTPERARKFCEAMSPRLGISVRPVATPVETVRGADIVNVITNAATPVLAGEWLQPGQHVNAAGSNALTRRELEVLRLMAGGANTKALAERLHVSPATVRNHAQNIFAKLGVHSRLEAVAHVTTHGNAELTTLIAHAGDVTAESFEKVADAMIEAVFPPRRWKPQRRRSGGWKRSLAG